MDFELLSDCLGQNTGGNITILRMCGETFPCLTVEAGWTFLRWQRSWIVAVVVPLSLHWCHFWQAAVCMGSWSLPHLLPAAVRSIAWLESSSCKGLLTVASSINEGGPISLVIIAAVQPGSGGMTWLRLMMHFISGGTSSKGTSGFSQYLPLCSSLVCLPSEEQVLLWLSLTTNLPVDKPLGAQLQIFVKLLVKCRYCDSLCLPHCF